MAWKDLGGYMVFEQKQQSSCGMACVAMVVHRRGMGQPEEGMLAGKSKKMSGGYKAALQDRFAGMPRMLTAKDTADPEEGTYINNLSNLLTEWNIANTYDHHGDVMGVCEGCARASPLSPR